MCRRQKGWAARDERQKARDKRREARGERRKAKDRTAETRCFVPPVAGVHFAQLSLDALPLRAAAVAFVAAEFTFVLVAVGFGERAVAVLLVVVPRAGVRGAALELRRAFGGDAQLFGGLQLFVFPHPKHRVARAVLVGFHVVRLPQLGRGPFPRPRRCPRRAQR